MTFNILKLCLIFNKTLLHKYTQEKHALDNSENDAT